MSNREDLEKQALLSVCACYYYDAADNIDTASDEDLELMIADGYIGHRDDEDELEDCYEYQAELAERARDGAREDGIDV